MQNILKIANISLSSPNIEPVSKDQWAMLGVMRFFLALVVLCEHSRAGGHYDGLSKFFYSMDARNAVMLFFIISGFSIASSIESGAKIGMVSTGPDRDQTMVLPEFAEALDSLNA